MIKNRIDNIKKYFSKIELIDGILIVRVMFKNKWGIIERDNSPITIVRDEDTKNGYMYWAKDGEVTLDDIFDYVEETVQYNEINEMKMELLKVKMHELSDIFAEEDLKTLQTLKFTYKKKKPKKVNCVPVQEETQTEVVEPEINIKEEETENDNNKIETME
jgi:hypothetical protein